MTLTSDKPQQLNPQKPIWGLRRIATCLLLTGLLSALYVVVGAGGYDWAMLRVAANQYRPNGDGSFHATERVSKRARGHRDSLVSSGQLVHSNYTFTQIDCPSPEAEWLQQQFLAHHLNQAEPVFSTTGRSHAAPVYAVNVWFTPDEQHFWDDWFATHNNLEHVRIAMAHGTRGSITK